MNIQDLQELLKSLETAKELSMASIANEVQKLKDDKDNLKKDLENVLLQIVDKVDSIPLNEEIGKLNDKLRGEISKLNEASEKKIKSIEDNIKKITADLIIQIESKIPETIKETIIEKVNEVKLDESPEEIAKKLNTLDSAIDAKVIKGLEDSIDASKIKNLKSLLPKNPPMYGGGSGASFIKSMRDVNLTGLTKDSEGKYILGSGGGGASLTVTEGDASPSVSNVDTIVFPNGTVTDDGGGQVTISISGSGDVTASSNFGTDNVLIKSDGTGKGVQATGISVADTTNNVSGIGTLTSSGGTLTIDETASLSDYAQNSDIGTTIQAYDAGLNDISGLAVTDGNIIVGNGTNWVAESGATARTSLGLGTGDSPEFTGLTLSGLTANTILSAGASSELKSLSTTTYPSLTELSYVKGTTSAIQTQLDSKYGSGGTDVAVADGGTGRSSHTAYGLIVGGTTSTGAQQSVNVGATTAILVGGGASALPVWVTATGTGAPVRASSPTLLGTPTLPATVNYTSNGSIVKSGNHALTLTTTGTTNVTFPTSGTLATTSQIPSSANISTTNTGTSTTTYVTPDGLAGSYAGTKSERIYTLHKDYLLTTGDGKAEFVVTPDMVGMNIVDCGAVVRTASSSGTPTFQIARGRSSSATTAHSFVDVLSTPITIDVNEYDSQNATTPKVINTSNDDLALGDIIRVDIDVTGTGTKGAHVWIAARLP